MNLNNWLTIILILLVVAVVSGLILGLLGESIGLSTTVRTGGIGVIVGTLAAYLIARKNGTK